MPTSLPDIIRARIAALTAERDQVRQNAERQLFGYDAAIAELQQLLEQPSSEEHDHARVQPPE